MRIFATLVVSLVLATPTLAAITVGATVKDTNGGVVGTVTKLAGDNVVVDTGTHKPSPSRALPTPRRARCWP
jgi:hypothetical protein